MIYVLNKDGNPLMPTKRCAKVRILLKEKKAKVYDGKIYTVRGTQNKGAYVALKEIKKVIRVENLLPYRFRQGFAIV